MYFNENLVTPKMQFDLRNELQKELAKRNVLTRNSKKKALDMLNLTIESSVTVEISTPKTDNFDKRIQLRYQAIEEILKTERTFIERLDILIKYFVEPLKTLNLMDTQTHTSLFGQLELIYNINKELLNHLENDLSDVARGFIKMAPFFKLYSIFAFDYKNSLILLQNLTTKNPAFRKFLEAAESRPEVQAKLNSLLIIPIQRIPRYRLLLQQVLLYTSPADHDYKLLQESVKQIENSVSHINSVIEDQEQTQFLLNLQNSLQNRQPNIVKPSRKIIKEGILFKISANGTSLRRYCVLLSDVFMYCKILKERTKDSHLDNSLECCCIFPLKKCKVVEIFSGKFKLSCLGDGMILSSDDLVNSKNWVDALKETIDMHVECRKTIRKDSSKRQPIRKKNIKYFESDVMSPSEKKSNFDSVFYAHNLSEMEQDHDLSMQVSCFKACTTKGTKRKHTKDDDENEFGSSAKKALMSFGEKLWPHSAPPEPQQPKSILNYSSTNNLNISVISAGEPNVSINQHFNKSVTNIQNHSTNNSFIQTPYDSVGPKKRVKFDEANVLYSSITYQRQFDPSSQYCGLIPKPLAENKPKSFLTRIIDFTANLF